jgi:hypothetical protein
VKNLLHLPSRAHQQDAACSSVGEFLIARSTTHRRRSELPIHLNGKLIALRKEERAMHTVLIFISVALAALLIIGLADLWPNGN